MDENPEYRTSSGRETFDKLFLLRHEEANKYPGVSLRYRSRDRRKETCLAGDVAYMIVADRAADQK